MLFRSNPGYVSYKKMHSFNPGEEIEYFSGNIVKMERLRNSIMSIIVGYTIGFVIIGMWEVVRNRKIKEAADEK